MDYLQAFDLPNGGSDFAATGTWLLRALGAAPAANPALPTHSWVFYNGTKNGAAYDPTRFVSSGVTLLSGVVYDFTIDIAPVTFEYRLSINGSDFSQWLASTTPTPWAL